MVAAQRCEQWADWMPNPVAGQIMRILRPNPWRPHNYETESVFIHVPRTAGGSISAALYSGEDKGHFSSRAFMAWDRDKFLSFYKFCFVRNPYDRLVSAYFRVVTNPNSGQTMRFADHLIRPRGSFENFVLCLEDYRYRVKVFSHPHFFPQLDLVGVGGMIPMDFVGRFENLNEDFSTLTSRLGANVQLDMHNATPHDDFREMYSRKSAEVVRRLYEKDFVAFGYPASL